jgi:tRNA G18 (ribose-2'-O)-methylase SpoU
MADRIKRTNDELKNDRPTLDEVKMIPKLPISILVENVRSVHNVGSIFRSADGFGASKIYLSGYTACPPRKDLSKTSLGSELAVHWEHFESSLDAAKHILNKGISLVLLEQTVHSLSLYEIEWSFPLCFIVGNEVSGVSEELSKLATIHAEIPMRGVKQSLNVSVATGVAGYEFSRIYSSIKK